MEIPKQVQDKLAQYQGLQNQIQMVLMQKQQLGIRQKEIDFALSELDDVKDEKIYKIAGALLIETNKDGCKESLENDKNVTETQIKVMEKHEKKLTSKLEEMGNELQGILKGVEAGGVGAG